MALFNKAFKFTRPVTWQRCLSVSSVTRGRDPKVCVVGSGPAGFYVTQHLIKQGGPNLTVDIFERLPGNILDLDSKGSLIINITA